jgi:hypothetical protein
MSRMGREAITAIARLEGDRERTPRRPASVAIRAAVALLALGVASSPREARAYDLLDGRLAFYGFVETRAGVWTQHDPTRPILFPGITEEPDHSHFAVSRTTLQLETDWRIHDRAELHAVVRAAWEPRYEVDEYANRGSHFGSWEIPSDEYVDPDDEEEIFRELWLRLDPAPGHSLRLGRQIVNWGESLAFRVADVVNPNDSRYSLFFLDPEETRIPQWMIQGYHDFPTLPGAPSLEWIAVAPLDREERRVHDLAPTGSRFAIPPEERPSRFPAFAGLPGLWTLNRAAARGGAVDFRFLDESEKDFPQGWRGGLRVQFGIGPLNLAVFDWYGYQMFPVVRDEGLLPFVIADYDGVLGRPDLDDVYSSLGIPDAAKPFIPLTGFRFRHPRQNVVGLTGNAYLAPIRTVTRFELTWRRETLQVDGFDPVTGAITDRDGLVRTDVIDWQIAFDLGGLYWRWLNPQGDFTFNLEYTQRIVLDHDDQMRLGVFETRLDRISDTISFRASTVYAAATIAPSLIAIYQPHHDAWAVVASLGLQAPWNERLTADLRYVAIGGDSNYEGLGFFRRKDFSMLTIRYGF